MNPQSECRLGPVLPVFLAGLAGGLGWGVRGQYGHETGAMIAGLLVGLVLMSILTPNWTWLNAARAVALGTIAIGFGGSETYAQTVGLTQDAGMIGNAAAWRWGMLGLAIKGALWIGFAGLFFGMGFGGIRYRWREVLVLMLVLLGLNEVGIWALNQPFDPAHRILPRLYFSADWAWLPGAALKPRREAWGGLLFALIGAWIWTGWIRGDGLARRLMLWGSLGGALGFPGGQCLQSFHAWHSELFKSGIWIRLDPAMNWWNWMETTFGTVMGATLGFGLWFHRKWIRPVPEEGEGSVSQSVRWEWVWISVHGALLMIAEFGSVPGISGIYNHGLLLGLIPMAGVVAGSRWPVFLLLPITLAPIVGKTFVQLVLQERYTPFVVGVVFYLMVPLVLACAMAGWASGCRTLRDVAQRPAAQVLLTAGWTIYGLNFAFFHRPWPWTTWTYRTPNNLFFTLAVLAMSALAVSRWKEAGSQDPDPS